MHLVANLYPSIIHVYIHVYIHISLHLTVCKYIMYSQQESLCELESEVEKREEEVIQLQQQLACMTTPTSTSMLPVDLLQAKVGLIRYIICIYLLCIQICQLWDTKLMYMEQIASNIPYHWRNECSR